jgi:hypothetical protein
VPDIHTLDRVRLIARRRYSLASAPSNGTRRGLTRVFNTGPVTSHAALARPRAARALHPPQLSPTVRPAP